MQTTFSAIIGYILGILIVFVLARISLKPIKFIIKLMLNSIAAGVLLFLINMLGKGFGIHIGINAFTSVGIGLLGLPAVVLILFLQLFF